MPEKYKIQINYRTEQGTLFSSYDEAVLADCLEKSETYLEGYKIAKIVKHICDNFSIQERALTLEEEKVIPDETQ